MRPSLIRAVGLCLTLAYGTFLGWIYAHQPQTVAQVTGGVAASVGAYRVDPVQLEDGLRFFRNEQFPEARAALERADPAKQDARTQFYIAYSFYRQGWHRLYHDDALYKEGLLATERAMALAPQGRLVVDDPGLLLHTGDELRAELQRGLTRDLSDWNPLKVLEPRK